MHVHSDELVRDLSRKAQEFRIQVLKMVYSAQTGHLGGAYSAAEILTALYFHHMQIDPKNPAWDGRDRLLFSKGHACAMLYTALANAGYFPVDELMTFRKFNSRLQGHPDPIKTPGVEIAAGPLGHGVAIGVGAALALSMGVAKPSAQKSPSPRATKAKVYVVLGDGELNAGVIWEGVMSAAKYRLGNLTAIVDYNGIQQTSASSDSMPTEPITDKWRAFGWHVIEVHGHNMRSVLDALDHADEVHAKPTVIIARTTKGKGVSFMEYDHRWHGQSPTKEEYETALAELEAELKKGGE